MQAIQDITRNRDIDPEEIVSLIFERIDVKGEGNGWKSVPLLTPNSKIVLKNKNTTCC